MSTIAFALLVLGILIPNTQDNWLPKGACLFGVVVIIAVLVGWVIRVISWLKRGESQVLKIRKVIQLKNGYWIRAEDLNGVHFRPSLCSDPGVDGLSEGCMVHALVDPIKHRWLFIPSNNSEAATQKT